MRTLEESADTLPFKNIKGFIKAVNAVLNIHRDNVPPHIVNNAKNIIATYALSTPRDNVDEEAQRKIQIAILGLLLIQVPGLYTPAMAIFSLYCDKNEEDIVNFSPFYQLAIDFPQLHQGIVMQFYRLPGGQDNDQAAPSEVTWSDTLSSYWQSVLSTCQTHGPAVLNAASWGAQQAGQAAVSVSQYGYQSMHTLLVNQGFLARPPVRRLAITDCDDMQNNEDDLVDAPGRR